VNSRTSSKNIGGIILAAGESKRLNGLVKQLIPWKNRPLISYVIEVAIESNLSPIIVVLGSNSDLIVPAIKSLPIKILQNPDWRKGKGTSIALGVKSLPKAVDAAMVFVVDQPFLTKNLITAIVREYENNNNADIIAPFVGKIQSNPVLFTKKVFSDLIRLRKEEGGKKLFDRYLVQKIEWEENKILWDIDTIGDYEKIIKLL
jgi:molybdenum cofactor cytidylyltransferase